MKKLINIIAIFVASIMMITMLPFSAFAYSGDGTQDNPYKITDADELQAINSNVSAHYILMSNIDLSGIDFEPIGNADTGAFSGSFDGNGYAIKNLDVYSGKYAGLFGYNDGVIKNVVLDNVSVQGSKYAAGVVAYNGENGELYNLHVISGSVKCKNGISDMYAAGVCAYNTGIMNDCYSNGADITSSKSSIKSFAAGVCSSSKNIALFDSFNTGCISGYKASGLCYLIYNAYHATANCYNCYNTGNIVIASESSGAGLVKHDYDSGEKSTLVYCYNTGDVEKGYGLADRADLSYCYNTGKTNYALSKEGFIINCFNTGPCKYVQTNKTIIANFYNTGNSGVYNSYDSSIFLNNSYNSGNISHVDHSGGFQLPNFTYFKKSALREGNGNTESVFLSDSEMQQASSFKEFDFENTWEINPNINSGYPTLKDVKSPLELNIANDVVYAGTQFRLKAYQNGVETNDVEWYISDGDSIVTKKGLVTAGGSGNCTITAKDRFGNKANCNIHVIVKNTSIGIGRIGSEHYRVSPANENTTDPIASVVSSDDAIASVYGMGSSFDVITNNPGNCTITVTSEQGNVATLNLTAAHPVASTVYLNGSSSNSSKTINVGETFSLYARTEPNPSCNTLTLSSSDESIATVDNLGNVTGIGVGTARIIASTDNGKSNYCTLTVKAPVKSMEFENRNITMYKGESYPLSLVVNPTYTTDNISYSSSSTSIVTVSNGIATSKSVGKATVTASASSGVTASCTINVIDYPVIARGIEVDQSEHNMFVGEAFKLNATVTPSDATDKTVKWESTDESVATVTQGGTVEARGAGSTVITASTNNGIIDYCIVNVEGVASTNLSKIYVADVLDTGEEYVEIPVIIENNPGISFASIRASYDKNALQPIEVINGTVFSSVYGTIDEGSGLVKMSFIDSSDILSNGILAKIKCKILDSDGDLSVKLFYFPSEIRNTESVSQAFNLQFGKIVVKNVCEHTNTIRINEKEASCTEKGYTGDIYCNDCETVIETGTDIDARNHDYSLSETIEEATVSSVGLLRHYCSRCDSYFDTEINKTIPDNATVNIDGINAIVTFEDGSSITVPKESESIEIIGESNYLVNINASTNVTVSSGLTVSVNDEGNAVVSEANNGQTTTVTVPSGSSVIKTEEGNFDVTVVTETGTVEKEVKAGESIVVQTDGKTTCAGEHKYANGVTTVPSTCTSTGTMLYICSVCGETKTEPVAMQNHNYVPSVTAPTCANAGYTTYTCSVCGDSYRDNYTDRSTTHNYYSAVTKQPSCSSEGVKTYTCSVCSNTYTEPIAKLAHTPATDAAVPATYTSEGKTEGSHCSVCGEVLVAQQTVARLPKNANTLTVKAKKPTVKYSNLKKKNQTIALKNAMTVSKAQGKVTYAKSSGNKKITVAKNGKITVKKGLKKGSYKVKIKVTASGNEEYNAAVKTVTVTIKVK